MLWKGRRASDWVRHWPCLADEASINILKIFGSDSFQLSKDIHLLGGQCTPNFTGTDSSALRMLLDLALFILPSGYSLYPCNKLVIVSKTLSWVLSWFGKLLKTKRGSWESPIVPCKGGLCKMISKSQRRHKPKIKDNRSSLTRSDLFMELRDRRKSWWQQEQ